MFARRFALAAVGCVIAITAASCSKKKDEAAPADRAGAKAPSVDLVVGLVTDVGGRGDQSFNDSALRGLELWAAGKTYKGGGYADATREEVQASLSPELRVRTPAIEPLGVTPLVLQSKAQEDYEPNLQLLAEKGADLVVGTGFMLENAIESAAKQNPNTRFLLIDSPLLDSKGTPYTLPNVKTVSFKEEEGSFLVGAMAALVSKSKLGFVGGMEIPLIKKFEAGFKAGARMVKPDVVVLSAYTGSFDKVAVGKQVAQDLIAKGADVVFHAAGSDGLGVIQAVKEARAAGRNVYAIGVDSDQYPVAPEAMLTSMVKRVDLAVYDAVRELKDGTFKAGDSALGLAQGGVSYAPVRVDLPEKQAVLDRVEALRAQIVAGQLKVPASDVELASFKAAP